MRSLTRPDLLAALVLSAGLAALSPTAGFAQPAAGEERLVALMDRLAQVRERRAAFREEKTIAALDRPLVSTGRLLYRHPGHLEKITTAPKGESLVVDGDRLTIQLAGEPARAVDLARQPELGALVDTVRGVLSGDLALLRRHYRVQAEAGEGGRTGGAGGSWRFTLTPSGAAASQFVRLVVVEGRGAEPRSIRTVQANGDEQRLTIEPRT